MLHQCKILYPCHKQAPASTQPQPRLTVDEAGYPVVLAKRLVQRLRFAHVRRSGYRNDTSAISNAVHTCATDAASQLEYTASNALMPARYKFLSQPRLHCTWICALISSVFASIFSKSYLRQEQDYRLADPNKCEKSVMQKINMPIVKPVISPSNGSLQHQSSCH